MNDSPGTICASSEFMSHDVMDDNTLAVNTASMEMPILAGLEAHVATKQRGSWI